MKSKTTTIIPHDAEAEAGALACVLLADANAGQLLDQLAEPDFHDIRHLAMFRTLLALQADGEQLDTVSLSLRLKSNEAVEDAGGSEYIYAMQGRAPSAANFPAYLQTVRDRARRRAMLFEAEAMTRRAMDTRTPVDVATTETLLDRLQARRFNHKAVVEEPAPRFSIGGNGICTAGNLATIAAGAKTAKTSFVGAMKAATMTTTTEADCLGVSSSNPDGLALLHFDTEQSIADHHAGVIRSARRAGLAVPPAWLHSYCVTGFNLRDLRASLPTLLNRCREQHGGIHSVILDGVADFVGDVNDPAECNDFVAELHALAIQYDCPIIGVIHFNPGTEKSRGHLGSQIERKAETNLRLDRDGDCICVWSEKNRRAPITKANGPRFQWSAEHSMFLSVAAAGEVKAEARRAELIEMRDEAFRISGKTALHWKELVAALHGVPGVGSEKTAIRRVDEIKSAGLIQKNIIGQYEHPTPK